MIVQWWMILFLLVIILFTSVVFANPFDSFENELKDYIDAENNQNTELDPELRDLFEPDNKDDAYIYKKNSGGAINLPSHINVSRLISTTIVKSEKKSQHHIHCKTERYVEHNRVTIQYKSRLHQATE